MMCQLLARKAEVEVCALVLRLSVGERREDKLVLVSVTASRLDADSKGNVGVVLAR